MLTGEHWTWNRINYMKVVKAAVGTTIAILVAKMLGLEYSSSAGIIALLSITDTKKDTIRLALDRMIAFVISIAASYLLFRIFGYTTIVFGGYILIFMALCCLLRLSSAVSICAVLTTHFLAEKSMSLDMLENEFLLFVIGAGFGIVLNLYMPDYTKLIQKDMRMLEEEFRKVLRMFAKQLSFSEGDGEQLPYVQLLEQMDEQIDAAIKRALNHQDNNLWIDTGYYIQYLNMRKNQKVKLEQLGVLLHHMTYLPDQAQELSGLFLEVEESFHEYNSGKELLIRVEEVRQDYKHQEIPKTREEFENRAVLYLLLQELSEFLLLKQDFVQQLTPKQIRQFWNIEA